MDFRSKGTRRSVNLSAFSLRSLKAERCDFLGEIAPALEPFLNKDSSLVVLLLGTLLGGSSKLLKKPLLRQKDDNIPQLRQFNVYLILIYREY